MHIAELSCASAQREVAGLMEPAAAFAPGAAAATAESDAAALRWHPDKARIGELLRCDLYAEWNICSTVGQDSSPNPLGVFPGCFENSKVRGFCSFSLIFRRHVCQPLGVHV